MNQLNIVNKRATYEFEILDRYSAGMMLTGTEIKAIRLGKAMITDAYCVFKGDELFVRNLHISEYAMASFFNHEAKRERKLLLNRKEINKLLTKVKERGLTIVALKMFLSATGYVKLDIGLARGKKLYDKRESIKEKDSRREKSRGEGERD